MDKDKAVQNQKVFVTLRSVVDLTTEYHRVCGELNRIKQQRKTTGADPNSEGDYGLSIWRARKQAMEWVIQTLSLPIETQLEKQV